MNFYLLKTRLTDEEINYYCENYAQLTKLVKKGNLSIHVLAKYIKFFTKAKVDLTKVVFNKKVQINEEICKEKIKKTLKYDHESFDIKIGNVSVKCTKKQEGIYQICRYINNEQKSTKYGSYQELFVVSVPNLQLIEVSY